MSNLIIGGESNRNKLGVDLSQVYRRACSDYNTLGYASKKRFPSFDQLFEEYCDMFVSKHTISQEEDVYKQIELLTKGESKDETQPGTHPEQFGIGKAEFLNVLINSQYVFYLDGELINPIVLEVW